MKTPLHVLDTLDLLRAERSVLAARLDAVDLALANLQLVWPLGVVVDESARPQVRRQVRKKKARRVPRGEKPRAWAAKVKAVDSIAPGESSEAAVRREVLLGFIQKSEVGLTGGELRTRTPKMDEKDRQNALSVLKAKGAIKRAGNTWVAAA